jgi:ABC-2 type transport system permease protein
MQNKFWFVAANEYKKHVLQKKFILALLSVPLLLGVSFLAGYISYLFERNLDPIGYVDLVGVLADPIPVPEDQLSDDAVEIVAFQTEDAARTALENEEIQAYYLFSEEYLETREVPLIFFEGPGENATDHFITFMKVNVSADLPVNVVERTLEGFDITVRSADGKREFSSDQILNIILPIVMGFIFTFVLTSGSGYFANAVSEEKESRTIELLATSMSANQFILGKVLGIVMVIFTQVFSWAIFLVAALFGANAAFDNDWLNLANLDLNVLPVLFLWFMLSFFVFAGITLTISSTVTETQEAQQMIGIVALPVGFSYWFAVLVINSPNSPLSIGLSMFPLTAPTIMPLRLAFTNIPAGQLAVGALILLVSALGAIWLAARAYELGMLRFGQRLRLAELFKPQKNGK